MPAIFAEASANAALLRQVGREAGVIVVDDLYGDSLGPPGSDGESYVAMMESNTLKIVAAFERLRHLAPSVSGWVGACPPPADSEARGLGVRLGMAYYPIFVEMTGRRCLVIGGGKVAEGKVQGLLAVEADVTLIAPALTPVLQELSAAGRVRWEARPYRDGDLEDYEACFVATDDGAVNASVAAEGKRGRVWVNAADDPANCDFILPAVIRQGSVVVAASTGGASPALARRLREELTDFLSEDFAALADLLAEVRTELQRRQVSVDADAWQSAIDGRLRALLAQRRYEEARERLVERLGVSEALSAGSG